MDTNLYRFFDSNGVLLYVGISGRTLARWQEHKTSQPWWPRVAHVTVDHLPDRPSAIQAESDAIRTEMPTYNKAGTVTPRRPLCIPSNGLVTASGIAILLGVSRQRVHQIRDRLPRPRDTFNGKPVWRVADIERWAKAEGRETVTQ